MRTILVLAVLAAGAGWFLTIPETVSEDDVAGLAGDPVAGESIFHAAGCASCHAAEGATGDAKLVLAGGRRFPSDFGTFIAPNISSDTTQGVGAWSDLDLITAIVEGTSPDGQHYYPAFPYPAYGKADLSDVVDLVAYMRTLPADATPSVPHEVAFPFNVRRGLGLWKILYADQGWALEDPASDQIARGRYLSEALAHCGDCHTPRNAIGGPLLDQWFQGAPVPGSATDRFPAINAAELPWSEGDIAYYLETGFTPDFDSAGGHMVDVIENMAKLTEEDRAAIAAYVLAIP